VSDERLKPRAEPIRFCEVNEVTTVRPLLQLDVTEAPEVLTIVGWQHLSEYIEAGSFDGLHDPLDSPLQLEWIGAQHLVPILQNDVLADALCPQHHRPQWRGEVVEAHAQLERLENGRESFTS
jgi:hypothetical protein